MDYPVLSDESREDNLRATVAGLTLRLFVNNKVPDKHTVANDLVECNARGYDAVPLDDAAWDTEGAGLAYPKVRFKFEYPTGRIRGYYLTRGGKLYAAFRFDQPWDMCIAGSYGDVTLTIG